MDSNVSITWSLFTVGRYISVTTNRTQKWRFMANRRMVSRISVFASATRCPMVLMGLGTRGHFSRMAVVIGILSFKSWEKDGYSSESSGILYSTEITDRPIKPRIESDRIIIGVPKESPSFYGIAYPKFVQRNSAVKRNVSKFTLSHTSTTGQRFQHSVVSKDKLALVVFRNKRIKNNENEKGCTT